MVASRQISTVDVYPNGPLVPLQAFGFGSGKTAAQNTAAVTAALAAGVPLCILPEASPFQISAPIALTAGKTLVGLGALGCVIQPPTNTVGVSAIGPGIWAQNLKIQYASAEPIANTGAVGFQMGGAADFLYESVVSNITVINANTAFGAGVTNGEFQNNFSNLTTLNFSKYGIWEPLTTSGSVWNNIRIQNESVTPTGSDCTNGILFTNAFNTVFNVLNLEFMQPSNAVINQHQSTITFNGLHFEQIVLPSFNTLVNVDFQNFMSINNFSIQNSVLNGNSSSIFNIFANASAAGSNIVFIDGFVELGNTFTGKLPIWGSDGNFNKIYVRGVSGRNSGNIVVATRNDLVQYEGFLTDAPGGRLISGVTGTASPAAGMPLPFMTSGGVALPWTVGDQSHRTNPAASSPWLDVNVTAGSPGTWKQASLGA